MSKPNFVVVTTGEYSDYGIVGFVEGTRAEVEDVRAAYRAYQEDHAAALAREIDRAFPEGEPGYAAVAKLSEEARRAYWEKLDAAYDRAGSQKSFREFSEPRLKWFSGEEVHVER